MELTEVQRLEKALPDIWDTARRLGLDPFPVHFEMVPATIMYEFGAYGLPGRFSHWTHGRAYQQIKTMYDHGLSKIYELVINTNPAYAFLLENNSVLQNKLVAAHVLAHSDFFKHNAYFQSTNRQMVESVAVNSERIRRYEYDHGQEEVETFLDAVLAIAEHVDAHARIRRRPDRVEKAGHQPARKPSPYDDLLELGAEKIRRPEPVPPRVPAEPEKDLLLFIAEHGRNLTDWQRDLIHIIRAEQLYFVPQMQTKIVNEGWASFWHVRIMRELDLPSDDYLEFSRMHAGVIAPSRHQINPYFVGMKIFEDIERRGNRVAETTPELSDKTGGEGMSKVFEAREIESDASFLRNYLTADLVRDLDLYLYRPEGDKWVIVENNWEKVRDTLVASLTNFGVPYIVVEDGDAHRNGELYLRHCDEGRELDTDYADRTLRYVSQLWGRSVHLETVVDGKAIILSCDGTETRQHPK
ncbi:MAG TPA: SpoVR family protein [Chloroflexota bacterium]|nr:SpoVR family protein [Chloroflexota bacterium]